MKQIFLDTNFLLLPGQYALNIIDEIERILHEKYLLLVLDETMTEIKKIVEEQKGLHKTAARLALEIIKKNGIQIKDTSLLQERKNTHHVDDLLFAIAHAQPFHTMIATQDKQLRERLKKRGVPCIVMKGKTHLEIM
ncbi:hypothetical protein J4410_03820 [Candidatus Woesearchaeota archaeon]|nr:hypothetical protein [Candidatus Woesearchaeota archaeon]